MGICSSKKMNQQKVEFNPAFQKTNQTDNQINTSPKIKRRIAGKSKTLVVKSQKKNMIPQIRNPQTKQPLRMSQQSLSKYYSVIKSNQLSQVQQNNLVQHNISGEIRRITTLKKDQQGFQYIQFLMTNKIVHSHIIRVIDIFQDNKSFHIISEHCNEGELTKLIQKEPVSEEVCMIVIQQILEIIKHLHLQNISHGNLQLESFGLLGKTMNHFVKLSNIFEFEGFSLESQDNNNKLERENHDKHQNNLIKDLRSIGKIAYQLMSGRKNEVEEIRPCHVNELLTLSQKGRKLINDLLFNYHNMTIQHYLEASWIKNAKKCLYQLYLRPILNIQQPQSITYIHHCILKYMINFYESEFELQVLQLFEDYNITTESCLNKQQIKKILDLIVHKKDIIDIDLIFENIDIDHNGFIQFDELIIAMINKSNLLTEPLLEYCFTKLSNNSGMITLQSLLKQIEASPQALKDEFAQFTIEKSFNLKQFIQFMQILI